MFWNTFLDWYHRKRQRRSAAYFQGFLGCPVAIYSWPKSWFLQLSSMVGMSQNKGHVILSLECLFLHTCFFRCNIAHPACLAAQVSAQPCECHVAGCAPLAQLRPLWLPHLSAHVFAKEWLGRVALPGGKGRVGPWAGLEQFLRVEFGQCLWFLWQKCYCWNFYFSLQKFNMPHVMACESHWIAIFAIQGTSLSFAVIQHVWPCTQLVGIQMVFKKLFCTCYSRKSFHVHVCMCEGYMLYMSFRSLKSVWHFCFTRRIFEVQVL